MASSDARHGSNGVRGVGLFFKLVVVGRGMERKPIRKVVQGFARSKWACETNKGRLGSGRSLNRFVQATFGFLTDRWNLEG